MSVGRPMFRLWSGLVGRPEVSILLMFWLGCGGAVVRRGSVIRALGGVRRLVGVGRPAAIACDGWDLAGRLEPPGIGRPVGVGRPMTASFEQSFFLSIELGVLAVFSIGCS